MLSSEIIVTYSQNKWNITISKRGEKPLALLLNCKLSKFPKTEIYFNTVDLTTTILGCEI
jgi:hypothetical protein